MSPDVPELDEFAVAHLKKSGATTGERLYEVLALKFPHLTEDGFADLIERLAGGGQIEVYDEPMRAASLLGYLAAWEKSLWFYVSIVASVSAALTAYVIPPNSPFLVLRLGLGLLFVLYLPGYVALQALYPSVEFNRFDRLALSVGVSLILDMLGGLALNFTPWGIRLAPILFYLCTLTACLATLGLVRQFSALRRGSRRIGMAL
jgi:uncharacterized membrane protein